MQEQHLKFSKDGLKLAKCAWRSHLWIDRVRICQKLCSIGVVYPTKTDLGRMFFQVATTMANYSSEMDSDTSGVVLEILKGILKILGSTF
jgi:hypothetical protein